MDKSTYNLNNLELIEGAELVGTYGFPRLLPVAKLPQELIPFNAALTERNPGRKWVHFFIDDYQFERVWSAPRRYLGLFQRFGGVVTPDFSMYTDIPPAMQVWNCYRNRVMAYWLQKEGAYIVPTVSWGKPQTYSWCFDGLPVGSVLAVSSVGCLADPASRYYFVKGFGEMVGRLQPSSILLYGRAVEALHSYKNIVLFESYSQWLKKRLK